MGHKYSKFELAKLDDIDMRDIVPGCDHSKAEITMECPDCHGKKFTVVHKGKKNLCKCFNCGMGFGNPLKAYRHFNNLERDDQFLEAVERCAADNNIILMPEEQVRRETARTITQSMKSTFCRSQLEGSGLTTEDVMTTVIENNQETTLCPFRPGRLDESNRPDLKGTDMLIYYYDLEGRPMQYKVKGSSTLRPYIRVRYANPDLHLVDGKPIKYKTPAGAPCRCFITDTVRRLYQSRTQFDTLFLQEGEKKAEKACKHGMISIGLQGINNIGNKDEGLLQDIQDLVIRCGVKNVVLVMDSDWNDLHKNITVGDRADKRPRSFSQAVIKFKAYMLSLHNQEHDVNVWWGHVNINDHGDKGVDDLLCGALLGRESELMTDIDRTMHSHNGRGVWLDIHNISTMADARIEAFWSLNDAQTFFDMHRERLIDVPAFKIRNIRYKVENGSLVPLSRYSSDVEIYTIEKDSKDNDKVALNYVETFRFLAASGFFRLRSADRDATSGYEFIHIDDGIIDRAATYEVRDFIRQYIMTNCKSGLVHEYFTSKLDVLLPDKKLESLDILVDSFNDFERDVQHSYYNNGQVEITADAITPGKPINRVWRSRIIPRNFKRVPIIESISKVDDRFYIQYSEAASRCEFLQYLVNTSNTFYTSGAERELSDDEKIEWIQQIVNKITTLGFLIADYKYASERRAVVIEDHNMSEVGQSHGGAGKSILGNAVGHILDQFFIDGKAMKSDDEFLLSGVTRSTRNIFIDDVKTNFDFTRLYPMITGDMNINPKGQNRYSIPVDESPKILITTNHAINGASQSSSKRRIYYMEFSAWYNAEHTPVDDFHHMLFADWDDEQWCLFDNLMAECVMYYFKSFEQIWYREGCGAVPPPMRNIELRTLRQEMSEILYQWAEEYFDPTGTHLNDRIKRQDLINAFYEYAGGTSGHGVTRSNFKQKVQAYCKFKGYDFNTNKPNAQGAWYSDWKKTHSDETFIGIDDKSGGAEYFTVYSPDKEAELKPF